MVSGVSESRRLQPFTEASILAQAVPLWRNGEMRERRIAECYRGIEMPKRLVQIAGFALKQRQLHGWTVRVGA